MKKMFRAKDRRQILRSKSQESTGSVGTDQPIAPLPLSPSPRGSSHGKQMVQPEQAQHALGLPLAQPPLTRRSTLHRTTASLASYRATPITKHYSLNNQILTAFESHYENKLFTVAYAIGLQFVETALLEIPKHGYFYSSRHAQERTTNSLNAIRVSNMLRDILKYQQEHPSEEFSMDLETELLKVDKLNDLAMEQAQEPGMDDYEKDRAQVEAEINELKKQETPTTVLGDACGPFFDSFTETMCPPGGLASVLPCGDYRKQQQHDDEQHQQQQQVPDHAIPPPLHPQRERTMSSMMRDIVQQPRPGAADSSSTTKPDPPSLQSMRSSGSLGVLAPPPLDAGWTIVPEVMPDRPEFGRQMSGRTYADHVALERALYLSGLEVQPDIQPVPSFIPTAVPVDDDQWMLEHALKESEREMEKLREQEEQQILEACQASEKAEQQQRFQQYQLHHHYHDHIPSAPQFQRRYTKSRLEIETLHMLYHEDFVSLWNAGRIRVTHVDTYQGKKPGSTNGCTVIAPLLCIHHFINYTETNGVGRGDDPGLPDETVKSVIDDEVPSILPKVREELGVVQDAFLIPSDSHDYLMKNQLLSPDQFVTVIGGNILDERHLNVLIRTLVDGSPPPDVRPADLEESANSRSSNTAGEGTKAKEDPPGNAQKNGSNSPSKQRDKKNAKIACTLFFHEHVVSILKLHRALDGKAWYDIIDSLPSRTMLSREVGKSLEQQASGDPSSFGGGIGSGGGGVGATDSGTVDSFGFSLTDLEPPLNTARIRCLDEEALGVALKWYACSKFNVENLNYIDTYPWDDHSPDFDPRVFQAFVWTEAN